MPWTKKDYPVSMKNLPKGRSGNCHSYQPG